MEKKGLQFYVFGMAIGSLIIGIGIGSVFGILFDSRFTGAFIALAGIILVLFLKMTYAKKYKELCLSLK